MLADKILHFLFSLQKPVGLPDGVEVMNPFLQPETRLLCETFYHQYYSDDKLRSIILGINPGRFGGGTTGIPFTDPQRLESICKISNSFPKKQELSSVFVYDVIDAFGGPDSFYKQFYISSVFPLGFVKNGKNLNYYDEKALEETIKPMALGYLKEQINFGLKTDTAFCFGEGKNFKFLQNLNAERRLFGKIIPLPHPRFVMQYRLKKKDEYIRQYLDAFRLILTQ